MGREELQRKGLGGGKAETPTGAEKVRMFKRLRTARVVKQMKSKKSNPSIKFYWSPGAE